jgi:hypothetical protein
VKLREEEDDDVGPRLQQGIARVRSNQIVRCQPNCIIAFRLKSVFNHDPVDYFLSFSFFTTQKLLSFTFVSPHCYLFLMPELQDECVFGGKVAQK